MQACHGEVWFRGQRIGEASNPGPPRRQSQFDTQLDSSDSDEPLICDVVKHERGLWLSDVRVNVKITAESQCIPMLSRGGSRGCIAPGVTEVLGSQWFRTCAHRGGWLQCQSPDGTPQSIHNLASSSVPESLVPSSTGHVRRRFVVVQSSRTPVVDMIACDTETDHDSNNSAPADAPLPRVWNEASLVESDTDSLEFDEESDTDSLPGSVVPQISLNIDAR